MVELILVVEGLSRPKVTKIKSLNPTNETKPQVPRDCIAVRVFSCEASFKGGS
jgi:hypothetical protein